ncbi:hypothetical protein A0H81_07521 [Grifola frondosa]|uniref:Uncharacterized protein n=1 Tax=Grifola frondosa TaxID=5627 RepID=A0A1C7M7G7_GRIFR|nr:hypothetical protein A0H81_07521 [Grifola frondosa]
MRKKFDRGWRLAAVGLRSLELWFCLSVNISAVIILCVYIPSYSRYKFSDTSATMQTRPITPHPPLTHPQLGLC